MNWDSRQERLLELLRSGEEEVDFSQIAEAAKNDSRFASALREELEFSELIRQALVSGTNQDASLEEAFEASQLSLSEMQQHAVEGKISSVTADRLARELGSEPELAAEFRRSLFTDECVAQAVSSSKGSDAFVESLETRMWAETHQDRFVENFESRLKAEEENVVEFTPVNWTRTIAQLGAVAAVVAFGTFFTITKFLAPNQPSNVVASVAKKSSDAVWINDAAPTEDGSIRMGSYELESGVVSLRFSNGQEMTVEGPARFDVTGESAAFVHSGIALAQSPHPDLGFTLESNGVSFSDSPRLLGIDARSETSTNALVFQGDVGVCLADGGKCREIYEQEAVKADHRREKILDIPYDPGAFEKAWELVAGVERNLGAVKIELPGSKIEPAKSEGPPPIQVFLENDSFRVPENDALKVDEVNPGQFASVDVNPGRDLHADGELRSYLLQLWPEDEAASNNEVEASLTFDHPVVGVIFSSDRLQGSDEVVGTHLENEVSSGRGLDSGNDSILLSEDRRTINVRLSGGKRDLDQVRVVVALN